MLARSNTKEQGMNARLQPAALHCGQSGRQYVNQANTAISAQRLHLLRIHQGDDYSMWSRPFTFGTLKVRVEEEWGLGIGGTVWEGGVLLAQYLSSETFRRQQEQHRGARCIEIGAGITALPSIAAAHLGCFTQIVVTDIDECIEALEENLANNLPAGCHLQPLEPAKRETRIRQTDGKPSGNIQQALQVQQHMTEPTSESNAVSDNQSSTAGPGKPVDSGRERDGWDIPQSVIDVAAQEMPIQQSPSAPFFEGVCEGQDAISAPAQAPAGPIYEADTIKKHIGGDQSANRRGLEPRSAAQRPGEAAEASVPSEQLSGDCVEPNGVQAECLGDEGISMAGVGRDTAEGQPEGGHCLSAVSVAGLDWRDDTEFLRPPYDVLLVADVVYIADLMEPLLKCMQRLSSRDTIVLLAYYERSATAASVFWDLLPAHFLCTKIPESSFGASWQSDDVGLFRLQKL